eukprot:360075-Chlamydomonas_euryale.AAC.1
MEIVEAAMSKVDMRPTQEQVWATAPAWSTHACARVPGSFHLSHVETWLCRAARNPYKQALCARARTCARERSVLRRCKVLPPGQRQSACPLHTYLLVAEAGALPAPYVLACERCTRIL